VYTHTHERERARERRERERESEREREREREREQERDARERENAREGERERGRERKSSPTFLSSAAQASLSGMAIASSLPHLQHLTTREPVTSSDPLAPAQRDAYTAMQGQQKLVRVREGGRGERERGEGDRARAGGRGERECAHTHTHARQFRLNTPVTMRLTNSTLVFHARYVA
jgi:hypothetical protein